MTNEQKPVAFFYDFATEQQVRPRIIFLDKKILSEDGR